MRRASSSELVITAVFRARAGSEIAAEDELRKLALATRREGGCLAYDVYRVSGASGEFVLFERWSNDDAWEAHRLTRHVAELPSTLFVEIPPGTRLEEIGGRDE